MNPTACIPRGDALALGLFIRSNLTPVIEILVHIFIRVQASRIDGFLAQQHSCIGAQSPLQQ